ncbi:unnamed protein product [Cuscuta europaea]|uniref:Uncharacterized protein n=1 Tax=Cuscuta europaea TaxID=41803 RepID=A0A9P1EM68_CUSEU|nr:unnamed protein product [Cuscuta europaea]
MRGDLNGVVVEVSEVSSGWANFVPEAEVSSGFVPDSEISFGFVPDSEIFFGFVPHSKILPGFVPEAEILPDFIPDSELKLVPVSEIEGGLKGIKQLRSEHLDRRGEASNDSIIDIYLRPIDTTNVGYLLPAYAPADPDHRVQERLDKWVSMWLPRCKK